MKQPKVIITRLLLLTNIPDKCKKHERLRQEDDHTAQEVAMMELRKVAPKCGVRKSKQRDSKRRGSK